jgi:hypothetical protein
MDLALAAALPSVQYPSGHSLEGRITEKDPTRT